MEERNRGKSSQFDPDLITFFLSIINPVESIKAQSPVFLTRI